MAKQDIAYYEENFRFDAPMAVWARPSEPRPEGGWWNWHSIGAILGNGDSLAVCGHMMTGPTLDQTTVIGHWPDDEMLDSPICKKCRLGDFPYRLSIFEGATE